MGWTEEEEEEEDITYWIKPGVASQGDGKKREGQERVERELGRAKKEKRGRERKKGMEIWFPFRGRLFRV